MKNTNRIKLNILSEQNLEEKTMDGLKGGKSCSCSCYWAGQGGASSTDNRNANYNMSDPGGHSTLGCSHYILFDDGTDHICNGCSYDFPGYGMA